MIQKIEAGSLEIWRQVLGMVQTNCYLVMDKATKAAVLVDPADNCEAIIQMQKEAGADLKGILLTHGHFDHMMAAKAASDYFCVDLYACEQEEELLKDVRMNCSYGMGGVPVALEAKHWVKDEEELTFESLTLQAIHTPGHTRGCMCYYFKEAGVLISGDTLFLESVGRTDLPTGNSRQIIESLKEKLMVLPENTLVLPGHGSATSIGYEKRNNPYLD